MIIQKKHLNPISLSLSLFTFFLQKILRDRFPFSRRPPRLVSPPKKGGSFMGGGQLTSNAGIVNHTRHLYAHCCFFGSSESLFPHDFSFSSAVWSDLGQGRAPGPSLTHGTDVVATKDGNHKATVGHSKVRNKNFDWGTTTGKAISPLCFCLFGKRNCHISEEWTLPRDENF